MTQHDAPALDTLPDAAPERDEASAYATLERDLRVLTQLAEMGLAIAGALERQALAACDPARAETSKVVEGDIALAFSRVSRAVRLTLALKAQLIEEAHARNRRDASDADFKASQDSIAARHDAEETRARIQRIVHRVAERDPERDERAVERIVDETCERLDDEDLYGDVLDRPISEVVAELCRDLGLSPDWPRLAQEAWAREELRSPVVGAPLAPFVRWTQADAPPQSGPDKSGPVKPTPS